MADARRLRALPGRGVARRTARASSTCRSSTPTSSCSGTALQRRWPRLSVAGARTASLLTHDVDDPLSTLGREPARCSRASSPATSLRPPRPARWPRAAWARARRRPRGPAPRSAQHLRLPDGRQRAPRPAQRLLLPGRPTASASRRTRRTSSTTLGRARSWRASTRADTRSGSMPSFGTVSRRAAHARGVRARCGAVAAARGRRARTRWGGRQHYLRWANPSTWRNWDAAGLDYDCTLALRRAGRLPDRHLPRVPRSSTSTRAAPLRLRERPFQVMDVTLVRVHGPGAATRRTPP